MILRDFIRDFRVKGFRVERFLGLMISGLEKMLKDFRV